MNPWLPGSPRTLHFHVDDIEIIFGKHLVTVRAFRDNYNRLYPLSCHSLDGLPEGTASPTFPRHDGREEQDLGMLQLIHRRVSSLPWLAGEQRSRPQHP